MTAGHAPLLHPAAASFYRTFCITIIDLPDNIVI